VHATVRMQTRLLLVTALVQQVVMVIKCLYILQPHIGIVPSS
jgi:hypothetical protein